MFNTHLKSEGKIPNGSKVVAFTRNYTKFLSLKANFTSKVKVTRFSNTTEIFRRSINSSSVKAKFQMCQYKSLKQIFSKFVG